MTEHPSAESTTPPLPQPETPRKKRRAATSWAIGGSLAAHALFLLALLTWPKEPPKPPDLLLEVDLRPTVKKPEHRPVATPKPKPTPRVLLPKPKPRIVKPRLVKPTPKRIVLAPRPKPVTLPTPPPAPTPKPEPTAVPTLQPEPTAMPTVVPTAPPVVPPKPTRRTAPAPTPVPTSRDPEPGTRARGTMARTPGGAPARRYAARPQDAFAGGRQIPLPGGGGSSGRPRGVTGEEAGAAPGRTARANGPARGPRRAVNDDPFAGGSTSSPAAPSTTAPKTTGPSRRRFARHDETPDALPDGTWNSGDRTLGGLPTGGGKPSGIRAGGGPDVAGANAGGAGGVGRARSGSGTGRGRGRDRGGAGDDPFAGYGGSGGGNGNGNGSGRGNGDGRGDGSGKGPGGPGRGTLLARRGFGEGTGDGAGNGPGSGANFGRGPLTGLPGLGGTGGGTGNGRGKGDGGRGGQGDAGDGDDLFGTGRGGRTRTHSGRERGDRGGEDDIGRGIWGGFKIRYYQDKANHPDLPDATFGPGNPIDWPVFSRLITQVTEPNMNFDWGERVPASGMKSTFWSMKATGRIFVPKDDTYEFFFDELDDAGSLDLDGKEIIKVWKVQKSSPSSGKMFLTRGPHDLYIEYIQGPATAASIRLSWRSTSFPKEIVGVYQPPKN